MSFAKLSLKGRALKLLGQRMDMETSAHRLEEFDAMIEAPDLWNDPAKAQKLMRERQALLDQLSTYKLIDSGLRQYFRHHPRVRQNLPALVQSVEQGNTTSCAAAQA